VEKRVEELRVEKLLELEEEKSRVSKFMRMERMEKYYSTSVTPALPAPVLVSVETSVTPAPPAPVLVSVETNTEESRAFFSDRTSYGLDNNFMHPPDVKVPLYSGGSLEATLLLPAGFKIPRTVEGFNSLSRFTPTEAWSANCNIERPFLLSYTDDLAFLCCPVFSTALPPVPEETEFE
jgi:hypothetical protein